METDNKPSPDCSSIDLDILIDESWIDHLLFEMNPEIPVNEKISLIHLRVNIGEGTLNFQADLKDKSTRVELTSRPVWNPASQYLSIEDLHFETNTKNILLKSAGWFAKNFLNEKLDRKLEEQANKMFNKQMEKLKQKPLEIPIPKGGTAKVMFDSITIHQLTFIQHAIQVKATVEANLNVHLT